MKLPSPDTKMGRVLAALLNGNSYNLFEAERLLHDHCLNSTISDLQIDYGLKVYREFETVRGYNGIPTRCCRYWIEPNEINRIKVAQKRLKKEALTASVETKGKGFACSKSDITGKDEYQQSHCF